MVTIAPAFNRGASIGQSIGQGLAGVAPIAQQQYQRSQLQQGLSDAMQKMDPQTRSRLEPALNILHAGAGIPGFDRTLSTLLPSIIQGSTANNMRGGQVGEGQQFGMQQQAQQQGLPSFQPSPAQAMQQPQQQMSQSPQIDQQQLQSMSMQNQDQSGLGNFGELTKDRAQMQGGILPRESSIEEMKANATQMYLNGNGLVPFDNLFAEQVAYNEQAKAKRLQAETYAKDAGLPENEIPEFMEIGEKNADAKNLATWYNKTKELYKDYKAATTTLENTHVPGYLNRSERSSMLNRTGVLMRDMKKAGREQQARHIAAGNLGMSPLEIEEQLYPASSELRKSVSSAPKTGFGMINYDGWKDYNPEKIMESNYNLGQWLKKSVKPDDSLLVIRDLMTKDNKYDWRQFAPALEIAMSGEDGLSLNSHQRAELSEFLTQAPRDSIGSIFSGWERPLQKIKGVR